jgi:UDP:flavonoid glycosyltransferase YjiC (YdhE family)
MRVHAVVHGPTEVAPLLSIGEALADLGHDVLFLVPRELRKRLLSRKFWAWSPAASWWGHGLRSEWVATKIPRSRWKGDISRLPDLVLCATLSKSVEGLAAAAGCDIAHVVLVPNTASPLTLNGVKLINLQAYGAPLFSRQGVGEAIGFCVPGDSAHEIVPPRLNQFTESHGTVVGVFFSEPPRNGLQMAIEYALSANNVAAVMVGAEYHASGRFGDRYFMADGWLPPKIWGRLGASIHSGQIDVVAQTIHSGVPSVAIRLGAGSDWLNQLEMGGVGTTVTYGPPSFESRLKSALGRVLDKASFGSRASEVSLASRLQRGPQWAAKMLTQVDAERRAL